MTDATCSIVSRRQFMKGLGATVTVAVVGGYSIATFARSDTAKTLASPVIPAETYPLLDGRTLVIVELGGGNDGLNTLIPHADPSYYDLRRTVAIQDPIDLDGTFGLHPELTFLAERFELGQVAAVMGVGYEDPSLSHFESMETWWTADKSDTDATGWLGRYLDGSVGPDNPLAGITIGSGPSQAMAGLAANQIAIQGRAGLNPNAPDWIDDVDELMSAWSGFAPAGGPDPGYLGIVQDVLATTVEARSELKVALGDVTDRSGDNVVEQLSVAASLIASEANPSVIYIHGFGDYDTHNNQAGRHTQNLRQLNNGLQSFFEVIDGAGKTDDVTVMTTSEFGRRVRDNGSGTDHGTAGVQFLIGGGVSGGLYGAQPSLTQTTPGGNMVHEVDFRSVYATVAEQWLQADPAEVVGGSWEQLPLFKPASPI